MNRPLLIAVLSLLVVGPAVQADLISGPWSSPVQACFSDFVGGASEGPIVSADNCRPISRPGSDLTGALESGDLDLVREMPARETIRELPPAPDSASLFLCAVGTLGAVQLSRSARRLHLGYVPEWVHTGGPWQIGNTFALDLNFISVLVPCCFEKAPIPTFRHVGFEFDTHSHCEPQFKALLISPRAPPGLA